VDVATLVFVLSAISPAAMEAAVRNVSSVMRPGAAGRVLVITGGLHLGPKTLTLSLNP
jgi:hypothetical protein